MTIKLFECRLSRCYRLIKRLENEGKISEKEYELIYLKDSRPAILYGSQEVHKPVINNYPKFRPIL